VNWKRLDPARYPRTTLVVVAILLVIVSAPR
jgi:hypothetical protein